MSRFNLIDFIPIIIIGCFVFSLILGPTLLWPKYQSLKELQNSINAKKIELEAQEQYFADIEAVKVKLAENEEATSKIDSALPDSVDIPSLFNFIQQAQSKRSRPKRQFIDARYKVLVFYFGFGIQVFFHGNDFSSNLLIIFRSSTLA